MLCSPQTHNSGVHTPVGIIVPRTAVWYAKREPTFSDAIAAFASPVTNELIIVCREGDVVRVPIPN